MRDASRSLRERAPKARQLPRGERVPSGSCRGRPVLAFSKEKRTFSSGENEGWGGVVGPILLEMSLSLWK
jgi:hypothetical protein